MLFARRKRPPSPTEMQFRAEIEREIARDKEIPELPDSIDQSDDAPPIPHRPLKFVLYFLRPFRLPLILMILLEAGQATCQILIPYSIKKLMDAVSALPSNASKPETLLEVFDLLKHPLTLFFGLSVGVLIFARISGACLVILGPALRRRVRFNLYHYLQYHSQRYFIGHFAGSLANRISEVGMSVNHTLWTILFDFWPVTIVFGVSLNLLFRAHADLGMFLSLWLFGFIAASFWMAARCRTYSQQFAAARSKVTGKIVDAVTNILNTKIFSRMGYERERMGEYLDLEVRTARRTFWFMEKMRWFNFSATLLLQVVLFAYGLRLWLQGRISPGTFAMVASLSIVIIHEARNLSRRFLEFFEYLGNIQDGVSILIRPHEILDKPHAPALRVTRGEVIFDSVTFGYPGREAVFSDLKVTIPPGERVGLVGFSGSGKTTFINLLLRAYDLQKGRILVDSQDIASVSQDSLRAQMSMIPQEPMLFHRSLLENIRYGKLEATDEEVEESSRRAHAHEFITAQKQGYHALVGERGIKLSGGQRQRIAIARAILKDAPIVLLDEATSSLDSVTEKAIQEGLETLMKGRTVIVVAHRLSTIAHLDRILVFHHGKIIEDGSHHQLIAKDGHYAHMWKMQAGGFLPEREEDEPETTAGVALENEVR